MNLTRTLLSSFKISRPVPAVSTQAPYKIKHLKFTDQDSSASSDFKSRGKTSNRRDPHNPAKMSASDAVEPLQGLIAINKPKGITSSDAIQRLVWRFNKSTTFYPTLTLLREQRKAEPANQQRRRRNKKVEIKVGHGGTLDPMATGVLVIGIGGGTKYLQNFLTGTKTYVTKAMFGCETDTYDALGKVLRRADHTHVTEEVVREALGKFRGPIMQKPPLYSALHHEGKRYYEYAREGIPLPVEIKPRPVATEEIELVKFTRDHEFEFPKEEAAEEVKKEAVELDKLHHGKPETSETSANAGEKHEREGTPEESAAKKAKSEVAGGAQELKPPVAEISMTVTKGFYVRSLVYDLGLEVDSAAHMVELVRTRQTDWELGKNVFEWEELMDQGEELWGKKVEGMLRYWWANKAAPKEILTAPGEFVFREQGSGGPEGKPKQEAKEAKQEVKEAKQEAKKEVKEDVKEDVKEERAPRPLEIDA